MKKIIVVVVLALVIVPTGILIFKTNRSETTPAVSQPIPPEADVEPSKVETVTVTYTDEGFSPQNITINQGSTVNFVNKSSIPLWVASDPHPAHTDYPEFDTSVALGRLPKVGEDFSFKFDKVGTWKYHSHTASGDETEVGIHPGVVTVK